MSTRDRIGAILRVTSGNFLEQFDFFLFGFYATYIAHTFFPASSEFASLMMTFAVFGAGFLMRPIGAIVLGAYIDKVGRRKGLIVTLSIMATGTFLIVLIPSYQTIGLWAPLLVLIGRLLQGFSAGAELGGVSVYLAEIATPGRKGFYTSWQSGSQQVAIMVAAAMGFALNAVLEPSAISDWGWRIPFLFGCLIVPFIFILRRKLEETQEFTARRHHLAMRQVFATLLANWQVVIAGMMMVAMTTTAFYLITVYAPTFGKKVLMLSASDSLLVTLLVAISNFFWLPVGGALSDRFGRRSVLIAMTLLALATAWPALTMLANAPSFLMMLSVLLWLSFIYGMYNGAMIPALTEIMPAEVRVAGFSLAYSLATAVFGGFTPVISTALIEYTGDKASPGYWMSFAAICGLLATCYLYRRSAADGTLIREKMMRKTTGTLLATLLLAATGGSALSAEVTVMISGGFKAALEKLAPAWEKQTGNHLVVIPGPSMGKTPQAIPNRLARGEHADVVIMVGDALTSLEKAGRTQPDSRRELADSPIGVVVKAGAPLPAIHNADQLRATLLAAPSVAYSDSASGRYVSSTLFHTLGIDDAMQSKAQMVERIPVASEVAKGRYAIGFQQVSELLPVPGVTFVGELPDNLQYITRFAGAVTISADHPQEGKALLTYLASPAAQETIHATGMRSVAAAAPVSQKDTVQ
ncbi:tricarballylate/proton symporter TcuC [Klebsiella pneumoniae]